MIQRITRSQGCEADILQLDVVDLLMGTRAAAPTDVVGGDGDDDGDGAE